MDEKRTSLKVSTTYEKFSELHSEFLRYNQNYIYDYIVLGVIALVCIETPFFSYLVIERIGDDITAFNKAVLIVFLMTVCYMFSDLIKDILVIHYKSRAKRQRLFLRYISMIDEINLKNKQYHCKEQYGKYFF